MNRDLVFPCEHSRLHGPRLTVIMDRAMEASTPAETRPKRQLPPEFIEKRWKPGQSGNPLGRASDRGLVATILRETEGGAKLALKLLDVLDNPSKYRARACDVIEAAKTLHDWAFGPINRALLSELSKGATEV